MIVGKRQTDKDKPTKICWSKRILIADYVILVILLAGYFVPGIDTMNWSVIVGAWITKVGVTTGFYSWKSKSENLVKLPLILLKDLPPDMREKADPNQIISAVLGIGMGSEQ